MNMLIFFDSQSKAHAIRTVDSKGQDLYVSNVQMEEIQRNCTNVFESHNDRVVAATQSNETNG